MDNIIIKINFTPEQQLKNELQNLLNNISKSVKIDLKFDNATKSLTDFSNTLKNIQQQLTNFNTQLNNTGNNNSGIDNTNTRYKNLEATITRLQTKLNTATNNNFINPNVLQNLQTQLNSINVDTPKAKIEELKRSINNLSSTDNAIVRLQNKITQMTNSLSNLKGKFGSGLIDSKAGNEIRTYEQQLEKLKNMLNQLKNGQSIGGATITNELNNMTNASRNLNTALQGVTTSSTTFSSRLQNSLSSMGFYISSAIAIRKALNEVKEGFNHVIEVEDSLVSLQRIYSMTAQEAQNLTKTISDQALAMGTDTQTLMDLVTTWKKLGYSIEDSQTMAKNTQMFNLAGDINNTKDSAEYLVSIMKGFNITAEQSVGIMDRIDSANNNFAVSSRDVGEALKRSSSALSAFGNDLPESISLVTRLTEVLQNSATAGDSLKSIASRLTGNSTATDQLNQLGIDLDDSNGKLKSTYQLIKEIGEKLKDMPRNAEYAKILSNLFGRQQIQAGSILLDKYTQLDEVINKINSDSGIVQKEYDMRMNSTSAKIEQLKQTVNQMWEKSMSSDFTKGLVEGVTKLISVFGNLPTVIGLATTALLLFKGNAIMGAISGLTAFCTQLTSAIGFSNIFKIALGEINILMSSNPLGLIAVVATTAIVAFMNLHKSMQDVTDDIVTQGESVKKLQDDVNSLEEKQSRLNELNNKSNLNTTEREELVTLNNQLAETYPELISQYNTESKCFKVSADSLQELINKKRENAMMENAVNLGNARNQIEEYKKQIEEAKEALSNGEKEIKNAYGQTEFTSSLSDTDKQNLIKTISEAEENVSKLSTTVNQGTKYINDYYNELIKGGATAEEATNALKEYGYTQQDISYALSMTSDNSDNTTEKIKLLSEALREIGGNGVSQQTIDKLNQIFPELGINSENASEKVNLLKKTLNSLDDGTNAQAIREAILGIGDSANDSQNDVEELQKAFNGFSNTKELIQDVIEEMQQYGGITEKTYGKVLGNSAVLSALKQNGDAIENLNNLYDQQTEAQQRTIDMAFEQTDTISNCEQQQANAKINADADKQESDTETNNTIRKNSSETVDVNSDNYNTDDTNFSNIQRSKSSSDAGFQSGWRQNTSDSVNNLADMYQIDVNNFTNAMEAKNALLGQFKSKLQSISNAFAGAEAGVNPLANKLSAPWVTNSGELAKATDDLLGTGSQISDALAGYKAGLNEIAKSFDSAGKKIDTSPLKSSGFKIVKASPTMVSGGSSSGKGKSGGGSGSRGGKSDAEKAQEEAEKLAEEISKMQSNIDLDRYFDLNNALQNVENELTNNKTAMESVEENSKEYQALQLKEIELNQKKQESLQNLNNEQKKETEELKNYLSQYKFTFDEMGNITNSQDIIKYWQDITNVMGGNTEEEKEKKQEWIEWIKTLQEKTKRYSELVNKEIPSVTNKWNELGNEINNTRKEMKKAQEEMVASLRDELAGDILKDLQEDLKNKKEALEKEEEDSIKALEEEKQAMIDSYDAQIESIRKELEALDDDYEDKKKKLKALKNELSDWNRDDGVFAKKKQQELRQQIAELEKSIKKDELNQQIDDLEEQKQAESDDYDERIKDKQAYYDEQKKIQEEANKDALLEEEAYNKADELLRNRHTDRIIEIMQNHAQNFKEVGALLGENFAEELTARVKQACDNVDSLLGKYDSSYSGLMDVDYANDGGKGVYKGIAYEISGDNVLSKEWIPDEDRQIILDNYYKQKQQDTTDSDVIDLTTLDTDEDEDYKRKKKRKTIASASTGGRTPSNIDNGAIAILHSGEMISNAEDTKKFDNINETTNKTKDILKELADGLDAFRNSNINMNPLMTSDLSFVRGNPTMDLSKLANNITNSNTNNNNETNVYMTNNIHNNNALETSINLQDLEKAMVKVFKQQNRRFR